MIEQFEALDGVGSKRAQSLVDAGFESLEELVEADLSSLTAIDGIGEATATDIVASAVKLLDSSPPTVETEPAATEVALTSAYTFQPFKYVAEPYRFEPIAVDVVEGPTADADPEVEKHPQPVPGPSRSPSERRSSATEISVSNGRILEVAGAVLAAESDDEGRVGRRPLRSSDFDVNLRLGIAADDFGADPEERLTALGYGSKEVHRIQASADAVREWVAEDPERADRLLTDREGAIADALAAADSGIDPQSLTDVGTVGAFGGGLSPVGIRSMTIELAEELH